MADELNAILKEKKILTPDLGVFKIAPLSGQVPDYLSGQYCAIGVPGSFDRVAEAKPDKAPVDPEKIIKRAYSIASAPKEKDAIELYIALVREGALTPRLFNLKVGDKLWVSPKITGTFTFDGIGPDDHVVLIATGTGLAPFVSMFRQFLKDEPKRKFAILHGVRNSQDLSYADEFKQEQKRLPFFQYLPIISRPELEASPWKGLSGHVQTIWKNKMLDQTWKTTLTAQNTHVFLCGNPKMTEEMTHLLQGNGYVEHTRRSPGQIHVEKYW